MNNQLAAVVGNTQTSATPAHPVDAPLTSDKEFDRAATILKAAQRKEIQANNKLEEFKLAVVETAEAVKVAKENVLKLLEE